MKYLLNCRSFISLMVLFSFFDNFGMKKDDYTFKVLIVGDAAVGKTQIINKFVLDSFLKEYKYSFGMDCGAKIINFNGENIKLYLWDTPGQEQYRQLIPSYLKSFHLIAFVYAVDNKKSFDNIPTWVSVIKPQTDEKTKFLLIGNKCDLEEERQVTYEDAKKYAEENNMGFIDVSAKAGTNIENMFDNSLKKLFEDMEKEKKEGIQVKIHEKDIDDINHINNNLSFCNKYCSCCLCL